MPAVIASRARIETALWIALAALAALRFVGLGRSGLWIDEAHTLHDALALADGALTAFPLGLASTLATVQSLGSTDEFALRLAPALFGALGLFACVWAFEPAAGRTRALVVACVVGLSSWHLYWSQCARAYTLAQDLGLLGGGLVLRGCVRASAGNFALGLALAAAAAFAHPSAGLLVPALMFAPALAALRGARMPWRPPAWSIALAAVALLAALGGWARWVWGDYFARKAGSSSLHLLLTCGWYFTPVVAAAAALGAWSAWRLRTALDLTATCVCALVVSVACAASTVAVVSAQYVFVLLPWIALLATAPLFDGTWPRAARRGWVALLVAYGVVDLALYFGPRHGDRPRWKDAFAFVWEQRGRDDLVFGMAWPVGEYYFEPGSSEMRVPRSMARLSAFHANALAQWPRRARREWFVVNREDLQAWERADRERLTAMLDQQCRLVRTFDVAATPRHLEVEVHLRE